MPGVTEAWLRVSGGPHEWKPLPNVWLGVSTERQKESDERIPDLLATPAAVRFISAEPLLGPIDLTAIRWRDEDCEIRANALTAEAWVDNSDSASAYTDAADGNTRLDWVIAGGESGPGARPMHPNWARSLRDQCAAAGTAFFFKQWGEWKNGSDFAPDALSVLADGRLLSPTKTAMSEADREQPVMAHNPTMMRKVGKKAAGRLLDGVTHDAMPGAAG
jgi:protein gp37